MQCNNALSELSRRHITTSDQCVLVLVSTQHLVTAMPVDRLSTQLLIYCRAESLVLTFVCMSVLLIAVCLTLQAIRAPLVVAILESYYSIHNEAWTAELQAIFPHLAKLVCSAQPTVRRALGQLMHANLPYALEDLPSS